MTAQYQLVKKYNLEFTLLFSLAQKAALASGLQITTLNPTFGQISAKSSMSWQSWGEEITIRIVQDGSIQVHSVSLLKTTLFDMGKNKNNVESFFRALDSLVSLPIQAESASEQRIAQSSSISLLRDNSIEERVEIIAVEEIPLDNRFGSHVMQIEHEFSRTTQNEISFDITIDARRSGGIEIPNILKAEIARAISTRTGQSFSESITRRYSITFSVNPGDFVIYKVIWKRKLLIGNYEIQLNGQNATIPYNARFGLEYEVSSSRANQSQRM